MKKILSILATWVLYQNSWAAPILYKFNQTDLHISSSAPPAIVYVSDSQGRRTGADPAQPIASNGYQGNSIASGLKEIPSSLVLQDRIENMDANGWHISIGDSGPQTYTINILGMIAGDEKINIGATLLQNLRQSRNTFKTIHVFIGPRQQRKLTLAFDPIQGTTTLQRVVSGGDLLSDITVACQLNLMSSKACASLKRKATHVQNAFQNGKPGEEKSAIDGFLKTLDEVNADGEIKQVAFTIIQGDATVLSTTIK